MLLGSKDLEVLIITGLSGAGKTQAVNCLEDLGYFCVDNLPPALVSKFTELSAQLEGNKMKVAFVIDVRGGQFFNDLFAVLDDLERQGIKHQILFLEASDEVLLRRFKESRRKHPLAPSGRLVEAIRLERKMLQELRGRANVIIDTSAMSVSKLKEELTRLFGSDDDKDVMTITVVSFGYKLGLPMDADLVMDVRFLPNPNYEPDLHYLTGEDDEVKKYVLGSETTRSFLRRFLNLLKFLLPFYVREGKTHLVLAVGCTGGQHRSVVLADYIGKQLRKLGYRVILKHRDVERYKVENF
ncbi:MAG: RNase adapter RapZ [Syntrophothermus sp.]|uniref:RNase adapter RapZ n=1 Tax=Syntrophothermus sp. TaxID=2736299 RepID=UPI00257ABEFF|nr:RNase adapter RapZ [Syntrophothermus sp.]NSW84109.1 RNase adapter RapZ [Syntrophothermus sp.]